MSYRIKVQPDILRHNAQQLRHASNQLRDIGSRVENAYNRMQAEARSAAGMGGTVRQAQSRATALADDALRLAVYLETKANAFEQADRQGHSAFDDIWHNPQLRTLLGLILGGVAPGILMNDVARFLGLGALITGQGLQAGQNIARTSMTTLQVGGMMLPKLLAQIDPELLKDSGDMSLDLIKVALEKRGITYNLFQDAGRWLNTAFDTRGNVGRATDAYNQIFGTRSSQADLLGKLDSWKSQSLFFGLDAAFGIANDYYNREYLVDGTQDIDWSKTVGVNLVDAGITTAIASTQVGAVVLLVNGAIQIGGTVGFAAQGAYNNAIATESNRQLLNQDVDMAKDALGRADLDNVIKAGAELVYDTFTNNLNAMKNTWEMGERIARDPSLETFNSAINEYYDKQKPSQDKVLGSLGNVGMSVLRLGDGLGDLKYSAESAITNTAIATGNSVVQHLPLDQSTKNSVDRFLTEQIAANNRRTNEFVNTFNFEKSDWHTWVKMPSWL